MALIIVLIFLTAVGLAAFRFRAARRDQLAQATAASNLNANKTVDDWNVAVERVKAERDPSWGGALEIPAELKHYDDRYWFLATQVAEIAKYNVHTCQDYFDLAAMIEKRELIPVPALTATYILFGIGQRANDEPFEPFEDPKDPNKDGGPKAILPWQYQSLQNLAKNFNGRSFDLSSPADRYALKVHMLSSIRPEAFQIIEQVATAYHSQFGRPLPVSSLVRPEQYQHALRRVNRNAVTIDAPPHSTGLAFDIDYRYMSVAEQNFVMRELARLKNEKKIEVIRERKANFHVFAFVKAARPSDELITASLEKAGAPPKEEEAHHTTATSVHEGSKKGSSRNGNMKSFNKKRRHN